MSDYPTRREIDAIVADYDYSDEQETPDNNGVAQLQTLCQQMADAERDVERLETELKAAEKRLREYEQNLVPEKMIELRLKKINTLSGLDVQLKEEVRASFPKDNDKRTTAFDWLRKNNHEGLIKNSITLTFGRGEDTWADEFAKALSRLGAYDHATVTRKTDIHPQTLTAFLREQLEAGSGVPLEAFGAFVQKFAKVKRPKKAASDE